MKICILGAGIVGLNTALQVQKEFPTADISIIAEHTENDTVSSVAAGIFLPGDGDISAGNPDLTETWITDAYNFYKEILTRETDTCVLHGVSRISGYLLSRNSPDGIKNRVLEKILPYRNCTEEELEHINLSQQDDAPAWKYGSYLETFVVQSTLFLPWAMEKFKRRGGHFKQRRIEAFTDILVDDDFDYLINCTGLGSKWLCNDDKLIPIRGQVYKVNAPWIDKFYYGGHDTYIIPGSTIVTLGGVYQRGTCKTDIEPSDSTSIWKRCTSLLPTVENAQVIKECVGLRPYRDPVRCGDTQVVQHGGKKFTIIHHYGHGANGIATSPGSAIHVTKLLKELMQSDSK